EGGREREVHAEERKDGGQRETERDACQGEEPVTLEDVAVKFTLEEWALMNSSQKKLYSVVMKETFLNLIFIGKAQEEKFGDDCKDLRRKMG
ncbi:hypothetical protein STEG23_017491, partial [Scotinomys teguina]